MNNNSQRGGITFYATMAILLTAIGVLAYMLVARHNASKSDATTNIVSPIMSDDQSVANDDEYGNGEFDDGLGRANSVTNGTLDEFGAGIAETSVFDRDINNDGRRDRITRTRIENGTAHFHYEYKIELNTPNGYVDITPDGFRTTEGATCALQKLRFYFKPDFHVEKISRPWQETWITPTMASRTNYTIKKDAFYASAPQQLRSVCNVSDLFQ